jgi:hypothetical protein
MKPAVLFLALSAFAQEPARVLEKVRDQVMAQAARLPNYVCTETIERSYYSRREPPEDPPSCERILIDRKNGRYHLRLDATDRLRVSVVIHQGREIYSWTGTAPYEHGVEDILQGGPLGTGSFAAYLLDIFGNPSVLFRLLGDRLNVLQYGFRVPVEASRLVVGAQTEWLPTGYSGLLHIDKGSLEIRRLDIQTNELPPQTAMCEEESTLEFPLQQASGSRWFLPGGSSTHDILRDTTETDRVATLSDCHEAPATPAAPLPLRTAAALPPGLKVSLVFTAPIDTDVAAAGDPVSATVIEPVFTGRKGQDAVVLPGATVTGRIVRMRRQWNPSPVFLISVAFETLESKGALSPFYARLIDPPPASETPVYQTMTLTGHGLKDWPRGAFGFHPRDHLVIPASFKSKWRTTTPGAAD